MSGYIGSIPVPQATQTRQSFTATASQTTFNTAGYSPGYVDVFLNGVKLAPADYTATNGSDIVLATGAAASDILEIVAYEIFQVADQDFTGDFTVDGSTFVVDSTNDRVGIGTTSPSAKLDLQGTSAGNEMLEITHSSASQPWKFISGENGVTNEALIIDRGASGEWLRFHAGLGTVFSYDNTERMRIDTNGQIGVSGSTASFDTTGAVNGLQLYYETDAGVATVGSYSSGGSTALTFHTNSGGGASSERMRIDSSGNVGIGTGSSSNGVKTLIQGAQTGGAPATSGTTQTYGLLRLQGTTFTSALDMGTNGGNYAWIQSTDQANLATNYNLILNPNGGDLLVGTTDNTLYNNTSGDGLCYRSGASLDVTAATDNCLILNRNTSDGGIQEFRKDGTIVGIIGSNAGTHLYAGSNDTGLLFQGTANAIEPWNVSGNTARDDSIDLGITSNRFRKAYLGQNVFVRTTSLGGFVASAAIQSNGGTGHGAAFQTDATSGFAAACFSRNSNNGAVQEFFYNVSSSAVGTITITSSATSYNTSSDHRLKENVETLSGAISRVKQLQPKRFSWIVDNEDSATVDGFLAHEAQTVVPEAVTGAHNEVDDDNNPVYQGIDQSKLVPLLTAALQEAIAKIETLETKVAALEAS